jgi:hypothetical protein
MLKRCGLTAVVFLMAAGWGFAQTSTINGRIVDQDDAVLPGVNVIVKNLANGATRETVTNGEGLYTVPALTPGQYSVSADLTGFAPLVRDNIELLTGANLSVELRMRLASVQESVTVSGQAPLVEATQSTLSNSIRQSEVVQLPMLNRSMAALMNLLPGAREVPGAVSAHGNVSTYVSFSGGGGQNYNMLVDGIDNKEDHCGGASIVYSLEGIQEFKTISTGASAEYGKGTTSVLLATKAGGNQLHGSGFLYGRNQDLVKIDYFSKPENGGTGKPPLTRAQFGGSFGGPIVKDKAFFFGSVERVHQEFEVVRPGRYVTETNLLLPLNIAVKSTSSIPQPSRDLMTQAKVNFSPGHDHSLYVRYASEYGYVENDFLGTGAAFLSYADTMDHNAQKLWNTAAGWTWVINPSLVNQFTGQFLKFVHDQDYPVCPDSTPGACLAQRLTFPSISVGPIHAFPKWFNYENKWEFKDDLSKQIGRHALKVGADYTRMPLYGGIFAGGSPGSIAFFDDPSTIVNNTNGRYPQGFRTPGIVRTITVYSDPIGDYSSDGNWSLGAYLQDDFKVSSRLTLNLGLRYDVYEFMNQPNLDQNRTYQILKAIGSPYGALPQTDKNNIGPRAGVAWDITGDGRNVVRGSYGLYFVQQIKNTYYQRNYLEKPIISINTTTTDSAIGVGPLATYVYGVSPLPATPVNPTQFPAGQGTTGYWYDPNVEDAETHKIHAGFSHVFPHDTVLAFDVTHVQLKKGWRNLNINPLLPDPTNPTGTRIRPLSADLQRVYGDARLMGITNIAASVNEGKYDDLTVHFERRLITVWTRPAMLRNGMRRCNPYNDICRLRGPNSDGEREYSA